MAPRRRSGVAGIGPRAKDLAEKLRRQILAQCEPGERLPSEPELAAQHDRSRTTVRTALAILEREGLLLRKQGSGTYVNNRLPRATGTTGLLFFSDARNLQGWHFIRNAYWGILEGTDGTDRHIHVMLGYERSPASVPRDVDRRIDVANIDSIIGLEVFNEPILARLGQEMATVSVDFAFRADGVSSCSLDHAQNIELAVEHLWQLGHRRVGMAGNISAQHVDPANRARIEALRKSMAARRLDASSVWLPVYTDGKGALATIEAWKGLDPRERPTALLCVGLPWSLAQAAILLGVRVPEDLSLLSLDDPGPWLNALREDQSSDVERADVQLATSGVPTDPMAPQHARLRNMLFSSVALPFREMGRWAMAEVLRRVGRLDEPTRHETFQGRLIPGNTVAPPPAT